MRRPDVLTPMSPEESLQDLNDQFEAMVGDGEERNIDLKALGFNAYLANAGLELPSHFAGMEMEGIVLTVRRRAAIPKFSPVDDGVALKDIPALRTIELSGWDDRGEDNPDGVLSRYMEVDLEAKRVTEGVDIALEDATQIARERPLEESDVAVFNTILEYIQAQEAFGEFGDPVPEVPKTY